MRTATIGLIMATSLCSGCMIMGKTATVTSKGNQHVYDLAGDWSSTENPNGVWSYNHNASPITKSFSWQAHTGWGYRRNADGCIIKLNNSDASKRENDMREGDVVMHALSQMYEGASSFVSVTWTSPADGTIDIRGRAWDAYIDQDRDMSWSLVIRGKTVAQRSSIRGISRDDKRAQFSANQIDKGHSLTGVPITRGATVEFRVAASTYYGHFVGVEEHIVLTEAKPDIAK